MFDRFTDRARRVMALARKEAQRLNHDYIGTEHLLLGLIQEGAGCAAKVLKSLGVEIDRIRREIEKNVQSGPIVVTMGQLPFTARAKKVLELSMEEANELGHNYIGTEHLLLGLIRENDGVAAQVLLELNLKLEDARAEVLELLGEPARRRRSMPGLAGERPEDPSWDPIELLDDRDALRARLAFTPERQPSLTLFDAEGRERVVLKLDPDGSPRLEMRDGEGKVVFKAP
ncbi:MAG: hypothetical protein HY721_33270 [Planctomycetes bacterium]|nr:hypothetical protein [Planctomycetota bacterium]